jgi:hypothetical protein
MYPHAAGKGISLGLCQADSANTHARPMHIVCSDLMHPIIGGLWYAQSSTWCIGEVGHLSLGYVNVHLVSIKVGIERVADAFVEAEGAPLHHDRPERH